MAKTDKPQEQPNEEKTQAENQQKPKAFFITPLGGDSSDIRRSTDGLIDAVIEPALAKHGIELISPHRIKDPGNITRQVVQYILECDLVIANLTGLNANVMYELAIRHAKRKPVIVIAQEGTNLPFDIAQERTFFYKNDMSGVVELKTRLVEIIPIALKDENPENPIYTGLETVIIREQVVKDKNPFETYVLDKLDDFSDTLSTISRSIAASANSSASVAVSPSKIVPPVVTSKLRSTLLQHVRLDYYHIKLADDKSETAGAMKRYISNKAPQASFKFIRDKTWEVSIPDTFFGGAYDLQQHLTQNGVKVISVEVELPF